MSSYVIAVSDILLPLTGKAPFFMEEAPFFELYERAYFDALLRGDVCILDAHREAIFYLAEPFVSRFISALIVWAAANPQAGYVESLSFYFSAPSRSQSYLRELRRDALLAQKIYEYLGVLIMGLTNLDDGDMADIFISLRRDLKHEL